jgi:uncharacterized membrane protein YdbT with pleckstrin-like domain
MPYDARPAWRYQWPAFLGVLLILAAFALLVVFQQLYTPGKAVRYGEIASGALCVYLVALIVYRRYFWRYTIDDENIESRRGLIARKVQSIRIRDLRNINVSQTVAQRLLGVGDVEFSSAAGGDVEVVFFGVTDPLSVKELAQRLQGDRYD